MSTDIGLRRLATQTDAVRADSLSGNNNRFSIRSFIVATAS